LQLGQFKEQWVRFETAESPQLDQPDQPDQLEQTTQSDQEMTAEQQLALQALYVDFLKEAKLSEATKETVDGVKVFVMDATVTGEQLVHFIKKMEEIRSGAPFSAEDMKQLDQMATQLEDVTTTIMVDRTHYNLKKMSTPLTFVIPEEAQSSQVMNQIVPTSNFEAADTVAIEMVITFSDYNQPVAFSVPSESVAADELFTGVLEDSVFSDTTSFDSFEAATDLEKAQIEALLDETGSKSTTKSTEVPVELQSLSAQEKALLEQYGVAIESL
jgi:hypothetical protein